MSAAVSAKKNTALGEFDITAALDTYQKQLVEPASRNSAVTVFKLGQSVEVQRQLGQLQWLERALCANGLYMGHIIGLVLLQGQQKFDRLQAIDFRIPDTVTVGTAHMDQALLVGRKKYLRTTASPYYETAGHIVHHEAGSAATRSFWWTGLFDAYAVVERNA